MYVMCVLYVYGAGVCVGRVPVCMCVRGWVCDVCVCTLCVCVYVGACAGVWGVYVGGCMSVARLHIKCP